MNEFVFEYRMLLVNSKKNKPGLGVPTPKFMLHNPLCNINFKCRCQYFKKYTICKPSPDGINISSKCFNHLVSLSDKTY